MRGSTLLALGGALVALVAVVVPSLRRSTLVTAAGLATATAACAVLGLEALERAPRTPPVALAAALAATAVATGVVAVRRAASRVPAAGYAAALAAGAVAVAAAQVGGGTVALALAGAAVVTTGVAATRSGRTEELPLVLVAAATVVTALAVATGPRVPTAVTAGVLAASGVTALAYAALPGRGLAAVLGVLGCSAAPWTLLLADGVRVVEAYSLPLAALALGVGLVRLRREPDTSTWSTLGPGVSAALLPSAYASLSDEGAARPLLTLAVAAGVAVAGLLGRWQAPLVLGSAAAVLVAASQLAPYAVGLPRWATLGAAGLLLLVVGARYEQRRRDAHAASRWLRALR